MLEIYGIIFKNGSENDYELWTEIALSKEETIKIFEILQSHVNEGSSVRGTLEEIKEEI